jgi:hypothetical protein
MEQVLFKMPVPSYELLPGGPHINLGFSLTSIFCDYADPDSGAPSRLTLIFDSIETSKLTNRFANDVEIIDKAYEQVVDFGESEWLRHVKSKLAQNSADSSGLRHLVIYFDGGTGLEFICRDFRTTTEIIKPKKL